MEYDAYAGATARRNIMSHETGGGGGGGRDPDTDRLMWQMLGIAGAVDKKAKDRDKEVEKIREQDTREVAPEPAAPAAPVQEAGHAREEHDARARAEREERDSPAQQREVTSTTAGGAETQGKGEMVRYDSQERRMAIAAHLARIGVAPELAAVRMLVEVGQAQPPEEATRKKDDTAKKDKAREQEAQAREKENPARTNYDSQERRQAIAAYMARTGVSSELAAVRMLIEIGQAQPPEEATRQKDDTPGNGTAREQDDKSKNRGKAQGDDGISRVQE